MAGTALRLPRDPKSYTEEEIQIRDEKIEAILLHNKDSRRFYDLIHWVESNYNLHCDSYLSNGIKANDDDVNIDTNYEWLTYVLRNKLTNSIESFSQRLCGKFEGTIWRTAVKQLEDIKANIEKHYSHYKK